MNILKELVQILEQNKSTYLQNWLFQNNNSNLVKLYYGLLNNTFQNDDEASIALYGKAGAPAYHKLKFDLKVTLYDFISHINIKLKKKNDAEEERFRYSNMLMSFNILIQQSGDAAAVEMGEYIYENCIKIGFTDLAYIAIKRILNKVSAKKLSFYSEELRRLYHLEGIEVEAKLAYDEILSLYKNDKLSEEELVALTEEKYNAFLIKRGELSSPIIETYVFLLEICVHSAKNDASKLFETAQQATLYFEGLPIRYAQALKSYYYYLIVGYTQRKQYDLAGSYIKKCLDCTVEGTTAWLKILELAFVSYLHSADYHLAIATFVSANNDKYLKHFPIPVQEKWLIYAAFLHFLLSSGIYEASEKEKSKLKKEFKLSKFKNNLVFYDKDKSGMNLNILLIEILILITEKQFDILSDRYEAIQKSAQRYIDESEIRSRIRLIFKILLLCIKHDFKRVKIIESGNDLLERLALQPIELGDEAYELEIIPYNVVWEGIQRFLK